MAAGYAAEDGAGTEGSVLVGSPASDRGPVLDGSLVLNGNSLTWTEVVGLARGSRSRECVLAQDAVRRCASSEALKRTIVETGIPVYGVTTGFGDSASRQISPQRTVRLQRNLVRYHLNGTGPLAADEVVRATMVIRANCLSRGASGVRVELVERLLDLLRADILPRIPERGSVGASGDLVPLCYLASALQGEGTVRVGGHDLPADQALRDRALEPVTLEAKEGLALVNGTSFMSAFACLALGDATEIAFVADLCTAMAAEALLGNRGHFGEFLQAQKPHPGQVASAGLVRSFLADSGLARDHERILADNDPLADRGFVELQRRIQDSYSVRCSPHVVGVLRDTLDWAGRWLSIEINSSNDNPLFDVSTRTAHSGGNFYGGHVGLAMDALKVAVASVADLLDRQLELVVDEKFNNGLTPNLVPRLAPGSPEQGLHHGYKGMQIACSALTAEALKAAMPATTFSRSTEAHNQDKVSMGTIAARDARTVAELTLEVAAIHLHALCQALDLRGVEQSGGASRRVHALVRRHVPMVVEDRRMDADIRTLVELIRTGTVRRAVTTPDAVAMAVTAGQGAMS